MDFQSSFTEFDDSIQKQVAQYSGLLGLPIDGSRVVNVASRVGFVYVRLRDNLSEVVQVYNDKVSPIYDFPVIIQRQGNKWVVVGKDTGRYDNLGTSAPFLPAHGSQHSFDRDRGTGGDTVWVFPDQFMPLLVYPSGTSGAGMLMVAPYMLQRESDFVYVGNTGTQNLLVYKPTNSTAIIGLVGLDRVTGNPSVLIASGTPMPGILTGSASVANYAPYPPSNVEPLYLFRLVSGTTSLTWPNLYNARQFIGGSTSTGSSGSGVPSFVTGSIPYAGSDGVLKESNPNIAYDETFKTLWLRGGNRNLPLLTNDQIALAILPTGTNTTVTTAMLSYGTGTLGSPSAAWNGYRSRGTLDSPAPVQFGDALMSMIGAGYDGSSWVNATRIRLYADGNWVTGAYTPSRMDFEVTPSGSTTRRTQFQIYGNAVEIPTGSTYNIGGAPHIHSITDIVGSPQTIADITLSATGTFTVDIPSGYAYIEITYALRSNTVALGDNASLIFNGDTGANYDSLTMVFNSSGILASTEVLSGNNVGISVPAASATANYFGTGKIVIPMYDSTSFFKQLEAVTGRETSSAAGAIRLFNYVATWKSTSAITQIKFSPQLGTGFISGSRIIVRGIR